MFKFRYVIEVEGDSAFAPFGAGDSSSEQSYLREAKEKLADEIQSFWQVKLENRRVTITRESL